MFNWRIFPRTRPHTAKTQANCFHENKLEERETTIPCKTLIIGNMTQLLNLMLIKVLSYTCKQHFPEIERVKKLCTERCRQILIITNNDKEEINERY